MSNSFLPEIGAASNHSPSVAGVRRTSSPSRSMTSGPLARSVSNP